MLGKSTRPLFFSFEPETPDLTRKIISDVESSLAETSNIDILEDGQTHELNFCVKYEITMIDGKESNALLNNTATLRCPVCLLTAKDFNTIMPRKFSHQANAESLELTLNPLHLTFKLFDFLLKIVQNRAKYDILKRNPEASKLEISQEIKNVKKRYKQILIKSCNRLYKTRIRIIDHRAKCAKST